MRYSIGDVKSGAYLADGGVSIRSSSGALVRASVPSFSPKTLDLANDFDINVFSPLLKAEAGSNSFNPPSIFYFS